MKGDDGEILTFKGVWEPSKGTIAVGESRQIGITFAPDTDVAEGMYIFHLHLESSNYQTTDIDLNVSVTQSGAGNILFKVQDIYTGTFDANDQLIQGVAFKSLHARCFLFPLWDFVLNCEQIS